MELNTTDIDFTDVKRYTRSHFPHTNGRSRLSRNTSQAAGADSCNDRDLQWILITWTCCNLQPGCCYSSDGRTDNPRSGTSPPRSFLLSKKSVFSKSNVFGLLPSQKLKDLHSPQVICTASLFQDDTVLNISHFALDGKFQATLTLLGIGTIGIRVTDLISAGPSRHNQHPIVLPHDIVCTKVDLDPKSTNLQL